MNDSENIITNEIDLYQSIKDGLFFLNKNKLILTTLFVFGVVLAYFQINKFPNNYRDYYQSDFYVNSSILTNEEVHTLTENLSFNYQKLDIKKYNAVLLSLIKSIDAKKELSIDGLRSNIRVEILLFKPQELDTLTNLIKNYVESADYYKLKHDSVYNQQKLILNLLNSKISDLGIDIYSDKLITQLKEKTNEDIKMYLNYVELVEKKTELDQNLARLDKGIVFLPIEPSNKLITTFKIQMLLFVGYGLLSTLLGVIVIIALDSLKKLKTKE
jgi:hypothetical protein